MTQMSDSGPSWPSCFNVVANAIGGEKYQVRLRFEPRASGILFLHSTTQLLNHLSTTLMVYNQIPVPGYIAIHF